MAQNQKTLPKGIMYRPNEGRYMGRFAHRGKRYTAYGKTLKEVQQNLRDLRYEVEHGLYFKEESVTFSTWFEIWLRDYKTPTVKMGTIGVYRQNYNAYIKNAFGNHQLRDIRPDQIQSFYNMMGKTYSHNTLEICRAILNGTFSQAVKNEIIQKNPVKNADLPRDNKKKERRVMTEFEQNTFLKYARNTIYYPIYELALSTGMRSGELRGLRWPDVSFEEKTIHIACTLTYQDGAYHLETPKTPTSDRKIPMLDNVYTLLKNERKTQMETRLKMGKYWQPLEGFENLVFTNAAGQPINRDRFKLEIDDIVESIQNHGIPFEHITPHTFRHTFATRSIERGVDPKVLQKILGHSTYAMTMDTYAHVLPDTKAQEMQKLACLFS